MPQVLKYCLEPQRIELIGRIGRPAVEERRIAPLMLMNVAAAQREPVILALVSNIAVEADDRACGLPSAETRRQIRPKHSGGLQLKR